MNKVAITILSIAVLLGGFLLFYQSRSAGQNVPAVNQAVQQTNNSQKWETKTDEQSAVTVAVTPIDISPQSKEWKFDVVMDTHSVELDQDMIKVVVLIDNQGKEYKPLKWEGQVGSHHREGTLIFNRVTPTLKYIELKVSGIGDVVRSFIWRL